jgi:hypothetical protein
MNVGDKKWWGPRVWRILHSLAEVSDRIDCGPAWRVMLTTTADMLPCAVCRSHFYEHARLVPLSVGKSPRDGLRQRLWIAHAGTGGGLPEEGLSAEYGCSGDRGEVLRVVSGLIEEVFTGLRDGGVYDRFTLGRLITWHRAALALVALLQVPLMTTGGSGPRGLPRGTGHRRRM